MDLTLLQGNRDYFSDHTSSNNDSESDENIESEQSYSNDSNDEFILEKCTKDSNNKRKCSKNRLMSPGKTLGRSVLEFKNYQKTKEAKLDVQYNVVAKSTGSLIGEREVAESSTENVEKHKLSVGLPHETYHIPLFGLQNDK